MGQLKRRRPHVIAGLRNWLMDDQTKRALRKAGHSYLAGCWSSALQSFQNGVKASVAFNQPGRPQSGKFTQGALRAIRVKYLQQSGMSRSRAIKNVLGPAYTDDRELRRTLKRLPDATISDKFFGKR
jgi:hypothetical protein